MKNQRLLLLVICSFSFFDTLWPCNTSTQAELNRSQEEGADGEVNVGVIVDMGTWEGKVIQSSISMAISDFCSLHNSCKLRVVLHVRNSHGDPFRALSAGSIANWQNAALDLLENAKVEAILGALTSSEGKFLVEFGDRNKVPVISFSTPSYFPFSTSKSPFFVQIGDDQTSQIKGVAAFIELHNWRNVILILRQNDLDLDNDDAMSYLATLLEEKNIHISFVSSIAASSEDDQIIEELHELKTLQTTVFIVHLPLFLTSRLFLNAKRLGMISKGYAWIVTSKSMNHFNARSDSSTVIESMQGVIGFRSYILAATNELHNFTIRLRRRFYDDHQASNEMQYMQLNLGLLAYDVGWSLTKVAERVVAVKVLGTNKLDVRSNLSDLDIYKTSIHSTLLQEILRSNFKGLGGEFRFINGMFISNSFEIVNVIGNGEKRVGFCTSSGRITEELIHESSHRRQLSSNNLESIVWPGGSYSIPQDRQLSQMSGKILKIGVPEKPGFPQLVKVTRDPYTNATNATGFCIEVFKAAVEGLSYQVQYEFIPFMVANGKMARTYNDLVFQVYLKNFDAVVGDVTITANRSLYVDFTMPFTEIGVGIVALNENKDMWIIFKPLTPQLWLAIVGFHIISCYAIWLIERQTPPHVGEGLPVPEPKRNIHFSSILVGHWEQLRNKWSMFVAAVLLFVLFILSSSYTATLASMMTVQQIKLNSKSSYIGYQAGSINITTGVLFSNLNFESNNSLKSFETTDEYANALAKGSKNGGVSAILDEIPYIKVFLAEYSVDYSLLKSLSTTNGFAFVFPKGSLLVPDLSREIAKLRESGKLDLLENAWFKSQTVPLTSKDNTDNIKPLTPTNFGGLFLISGVLAVLPFLISQIPLLYHYLHDVRIWMMNRVMVWRQVHLFMKNFRRMSAIQSAAVHPQVQMT